MLQKIIDFLVWFGLFRAFKTLCWITRDPPETPEAQWGWRIDDSSVQTEFRIEFDRSNRQLRVITSPRRLQNRIFEKFKVNFWAFWNIKSGKLCQKRLINIILASKTFYKRRKSILGTENSWKFDLKIRFCKRLGSIPGLQTLEHSNLEDLKVICEYLLI